MYCMKCGAQLSDGSAFCSRCGAMPARVASQTQLAGDVSPKSRLATSLLAFFVGEFGVHRFYAGKTATATIMLVGSALAYALVIGGIIGEAAPVDNNPWWIGIVAGILVGTLTGVWSLVDFVMALAGSFKDGEGKPVKNW